MAHKQTHDKAEVFKILIDKAVAGETTTYDEVLELLSRTDLVANQKGAYLAPILREIHELWDGRNGSHITSIVVRKSGTDAGVPGPGFWKLMDMPEASLEVKRQLTRRYHTAVFELFAALRSDALSEQAAKTA